MNNVRGQGAAKRMEGMTPTSLVALLEYAKKTQNGYKVVDLVV